LVVIQPKVIKPRLIIYNVPNEITTENVVAIIRTQNTELLTNGKDTEAKYMFKNRKRRHNIVVEISSLIRKKFYNLE
jgi:hypothetical protein